MHFINQQQFFLMYGDGHPHLSLIHLKNWSNYAHFRVYDEVLGFNTWTTCTFVMDSVNNILNTHSQRPRASLQVCVLDRGTSSWILWAREGLLGGGGKGGGGRCLGFMGGEVRWRKRVYGGNKELWPKRALKRKECHRIERHWKQTQKWRRWEREVKGEGGGIGIVQKVEHIRKDNDEQTYIWGVVGFIYIMHESCFLNATPE